MIDTNLFISAALFPDSVLAAIIFAAADKYALVLSTQILDELRAVVKRKFPNRVSETENLLRRLRYEIAYTPEYIDQDAFPKVRDPKDYPILASAILANIDVFISGDADFEDVAIEYPEILKPSEFAKKYL
jgi:putative PIN family toxin of toxin-antitoxin system